MSTNFVFKPGKLSILMDGGAGSSGKGKLGSYICEHADNVQFACNAFMPQAGHWIKLDDGRTFFYQTLNSCAYLLNSHPSLEKLYIGPGACLEMPALMREMTENRLDRKRLGISPLASILQDYDQGYERGTCDFNGIRLADAKILGGPLAATGTTAHGCGANRARRVLRRPEAKYARDIPELQDMICDVPGEIMYRLDRSQSGLLEIAQGFQLSYMLPQFFPMTTSRNCTVAAGFDDMMLPVQFAGPVVLNFRTYPIRINNNKFVDSMNGAHLTWAEVLARVPAGSDNYEKNCVRVIRGNSGPGYDDQTEISWADLTASSGSPVPICEMTSVTKLPRRVFTFSTKNVMEAIQYNRTGQRVFVSINFMNYVDYAMTGSRARSDVSPKALAWLDENCQGFTEDIKFLGTGERTDDTIII